MTIKSYEQDGGFRVELAHIRDIGSHMVALADAIPTRPNRKAELHAYSAVMDALENLRDEIIKTRNGEMSNESSSATGMSRRGAAENTTT